MQQRARARNEPRPEIARVGRQRLYEKLVEQLAAYITEADLRLGDRLPSERELAARFGVSRATLSQALVALEVLGVLDVQHGSGAVVMARPTAQAASNRLREHSARLPEIIEARSTLEVKLASLAALRRSDTDLGAIESALELMADEIADGGRGVRGDELFHRAVTAAAHSTVLADMMAVVQSLIRETRIESLGQPGRPRQSLASHRKILNAIRHGDAQDAARAMEEHIAVVADIALLRE